MLIDTRSAASFGANWLSLPILRSPEVVWFWIGNHTDYDQLIRSLVRCNAELGCYLLVAVCRDRKIDVVTV